MATAQPSLLWDPLNSPDWKDEKYTPEALARIKRDLHSIFTDPPPGICVVPDGDNITKVHILLTGPFDTPYEGGFFHFVLCFPPTYPHQPPRVRLLTTGGGTVRFNPNMFPSGRICLSIIGTFRGPGWTPSLSLCSVAISIQSLMNDKPYHNEPGYENERRPGDVQNYNDIIVHETLRVAVCDSIEHEHHPSELSDIKKEAFLGFYDHYLSTASRLAAKLDGQVMLDPYESNKGTFNFTSILGRLKQIHTRLISSNIASTPVHQ